MTHYTIGCIGAGRITRILLEGWKKAGKWPQSILVSDTNVETLSKLKERFPEIVMAVDGNERAAACDIVFLSVHPPVVKEVIAGIAHHLTPESILVSLVPKFSIAALTTLLGGFQRIARVIPNAPSLVNSGYNPLVFSETLNEKEKAELLDIFRPLGECPEVEEQMLEVYAILTAMGPTYFWFQFYELQKLAISFGLSADEAQKGIAAMVDGAMQTMNGAGLSPENVMDLIPVKPLGDEEETIRNIYRSKLEKLFNKLTS